VEASVEEVKNDDNVEESFDMDKEMEELGIDDDEDIDTADVNLSESEE